MSFLLETLSKRSTAEEVQQALTNYRAHLESIRGDLPSSAYDFASAPWHYDYVDHRCPHDSWVESLLISEQSGGERHTTRWCDIQVRLLGAFHDGRLELSYRNVSYYLLGASIAAAPPVGHGDWLADEVRLSDNKLALHEILFSTGSKWLIESQDIEFRWLPNT